ncbi:hypothetical protein ACQ4PT_021055 [Festuca glaucescens]
MAFGRLGEGSGELEIFKVRALQIVRRSRDPTRGLQFLRSKVAAFLEFDINSSSTLGVEQGTAVEAVTHSKSPVDAVAADGVLVPSNQVNALDRNLAVSEEDPVFAAGSKILQEKEEVPMEEGILEIDLDRTTSNTVQFYAHEAIVDSTVQLYAQGVFVDTDGGGASDLSSMWCAHFEINLLAECVKFVKGQAEGVQLQATHIVTGFTFDPGVLLYSLRHRALRPNNIEISFQRKAASEHKEQENMMIGEGGRSAAAGEDSEDDHIVTAAVGDVLQITTMVENLIVNECRNNMMDCAPNPQVNPASKTDRAARVQEATDNLKRTFDGVRELRSQWEKRSANPKASPKNSQSTKDRQEKEPTVGTSPVTPVPAGKEQPSAKTVSDSESQRFKVSGVNYRIFKHRRGTVNQLRICELHGTKGVAELRANSLLGNRVAEFERAHEHEEVESSCEVLLGPKHIRHGIRQLRTGWADGPAYITQCPIQTGQTYVYRFTVTGQRGTLWWHAHISWIRSTVYGAIVVLPKLGVPYPFPAPHKEIPVILGEWWAADTDDVMNQALQVGGAPNISDAYTINGFPGPLYNCSAKDTFKLTVMPGKTYLLRLVNAALNAELFFSVANHTLTVVEVDAVYVKPFTVETLFISPGQTTNVLLAAKPVDPNASFYMSAAAYSVVRPPAYFDNTIALLQSHYTGKSRGVYESDFPAIPLSPFNYTGTPPNNTNLATGTRLLVLPYNTSVELVLQDTSVIGIESHPLHLHGYNFFVVGQGFGNYDPTNDPTKFNLVDPVERNTVSVPAGGWVVIRFLAKNPGAFDVGAENGMAGAGREQAKREATPTAL